GAAGGGHEGLRRLRRRHRQPALHGHSRGLRRHPMRHPTLTTVGALLGAFLGLCGTSVAQYDCLPGTFDIPKIACVDDTLWNEQPEYFGAYSDIRIPTMACAGCDGTLTNGIEMSQYGYYQVTAGYALEAAHPTGYYYISELPPGGQQRFTFLGPVQQPGA